jgi:hypothetical protein
MRRTSAGESDGYGRRRKLAVLLPMTGTAKRRLRPACATASLPRITPKAGGARGEVLQHPWHRQRRRVKPPWPRQWKAAQMIVGRSRDEVNAVYERANTGMP